jgi:peptidoglycan/LPS O-acetylase OafA/YrhL
MGTDDTTTTMTTTAADPAPARGSERIVGVSSLTADVRDDGRQSTDDPLVEPSPHLRARRKPSWQTRKLGYQPALDGLRALAVGLVILYHLGYSGVAGGYIGVELFFVLSGWLVCALLVNEHQRTDGIAFGQFWLRRLRRLLPAVIVVVAGTLAWAALTRPDLLAELRHQTVGALGYHLNWQLILDDKSYFAAAGGPSALEHLWSLSIEEQFYLVFPLLCGLLLTRVSRKWAVAIALAGAVAATAARFVLAGGGGEPTRLYFGTDTRAAGLLAGVALGLFWTPNRLRPHTNPRFVAALDAVAVAGVAVVVWYATGLTERDSTAFRGGFTATQIATLALIAVVVYPAPTRTSRLLASGPLRWVGQRSYGIYLIHWPVIVFTAAAPGQQPEPLPRVAMQVALILGLSAASYRWIEHPVRMRGFGDALRDAGYRVRHATQGRPGLTVGAAVIAVVLAGAAVDVTREVVTASAPESDQPTSVLVTAPPTTAGTTTTAPPATAPATTVATSAPPTSAPPPPPPGSPVGGFTAIGDSVLVGAAPALSARLGGAVTVDGAVGRQMNEVVPIIHGLDAQGVLGQTVLLHLGNNGPFTANQVDEVFAALGGRKVLLVNVMVPRRWEGEVNDQLAQAVGRHPNAVLIDWWSLVTTEPGLTREDGYHLTPAGAERYTDLVVGQVPR